MGKKKGKRVDPAKKAALQARKEAKAEKVVSKRLGKPTGDVDDLDALLSQYQQANLEIQATQHRILESFPPPRANATFTLAEDKKKNSVDAYMFGGEYFNGAENVVSNQFFVCNLSKLKWTEILSPIKPPARCAHSAIYYNHAIYIFGGETFQDDVYSHFKDLWKFSIKDQTWTEIPGGNHTPSSRSGHSAVLWKNYMIICFGFHESKDAPRFFDDIKIFNLQTETWLDIHHSKLTTRPEARSAANVCVVGDDLLIHGGFSKLSSARITNDDDSVVSETKVHTDAWLLHLSPILNGDQPTWERLTSSVLRNQFTSNNPNGRSGTVATAYKDRMLCFGGVLDKEQLNHKMDSIFYNDIFSFDLGKHKWYPAGPHADRSTKKTSSTPDSDEEIESKGWDVDTLRSDMFAFVDANGNPVYEKAAGQRKSKQDGKDADSDSDEDLGGSGMKAVQNSSVMRVDPKTNRPIAVKRSEPLPRINAEILLNGSTLYVYGGLLEIGDREVTLDDMWVMDVKKRDAWQCLYEGTMHKQVWKGAAFDDDDSYYSTGAENGRGTEASSGEEESSSEDESPEPQLSASELKDQIKKLIKENNINDDEKTPRPGEGIDAFYARTKDTWKSEEGLASAQARFDYLEPILQKIKDLDLQRKAQKKKEKQSS